MDAILRTDGLVDLFVGRQPILDRSLRTVGYELLFRDHADAVTADVRDGDAATARVLLHAITEIGLHRLVGPRRAFINLTTTIACRPDLLDSVPPDRVVLEVLEEVRPTAAVLDGLAELARRGYTIAIDDLEYEPGLDVMLDHARVVKYDHSRVAGDRLRDRIHIDHAAGRSVVVEHLETYDAYHDARSAGADYFQGFFFAHPTTISTRTVAPQRLALLELLAKVLDPDAGVDDVVDALRHDVAMSVKTLRYINSAALSLESRVESIQHAAVLLGRDILRSWASLALMSAFDNHPAELVTMALTRARFCELVAQQANAERIDAQPNPATFYTVGLLSLLDTMTATPMAQLVDQLPVNDDIRAGLLGHDHPTAHVLRQARQLDTHEHAEPALVDAYLDAIAWTNQLTARLQCSTTVGPDGGRP